MLTRNAMPALHGLTVTEHFGIDFAATEPAPLDALPPTAPAGIDRALQRKLHAWELNHLRVVLADQQAQIHALQAQLDETLRALTRAEDDADHWRCDALDAINEAGCTPGLTADGRVVAVQAGGAA